MEEVLTENRRRAGRWEGAGLRCSPPRLASQEDTDTGTAEILQLTKWATIPSI